MSGSFSVWADIFGLRRSAPAIAPPGIGDVFVLRPQSGPVEYAQVIGVYEEIAPIYHVRFRLIYGYQDKTEDMGERTLAAELFARRFTERLETAQEDAVK